MLQPSSMSLFGVCVCHTRFCLLYKHVRGLGGNSLEMVLEPSHHTNIRAPPQSGLQKLLATGGNSQEMLPEASYHMAALIRRALPQ